MKARKIFPKRCQPSAARDRERNMNKKVHHEIPAMKFQR